MQWVYMHSCSYVWVGTESTFAGCLSFRPSKLIHRDPRLNGLSQWLKYRECTHRPTVILQPTFYRSKHCPASWLSMLPSGQGHSWMLAGFINKTIMLVSELQRSIMCESTQLSDFLQDARTWKEFREKIEDGDFGVYRMAILGILVDGLKPYTRDENTILPREEEKEPAQNFAFIIEVTEDNYKNLGT